MTKFEFEINKNRVGKTINVIINDLEKNTTFDAWIISNTLQQIDSILPQGFELDRITTLQNYLNPDKIAKYEIELYNSQYVYYTDFEKLVEYGVYKYIAALENEDFAKTNRMDRMASDKHNNK